MKEIEIHGICADGALSLDDMIDARLDLLLHGRATR